MTRTSITDISDATTVEEAIAFVEDCADEVVADQGDSVSFEDAAWEIAGTCALQLWQEEKYRMAHELLRCYLGVKPSENQFIRQLFPPQPVFAVWLSQMHSLNIELNTTMRHSKGSVLKAVNANHNKNFRTKKEAYDYMYEKCHAHLGDLT